MDPIAVTLAASAATTLVQAMITDGWEAVRDRFAGLFGRAATGVVAELERSRLDALAGPELAEEVVGEWKPKLRRLLTDNPEAVQELRALLEELAPRAEESGVANTITGDVSGIAVQARTIHGGVAATAYRGDHLDQRVARAGRDVIGGQHDDPRGPGQDG
ncbi:hypothetical protein [Nocardiopsis ansamitocini]|uniref:Uncharacterized protein n=1 Tax=Nocardiopsis ansamitocini TaxID=1670832 RepID=A0A9W6P8Q8_9ACTN|nr:hypothetical protein [Nocardiopsis ansamitocini]GLU49181.1 hypothetical protein Nans01_35320 [Nocardiopsis ansamitocini]